MFSSRRWLQIMDTTLSQSCLRLRSTTTNKVPTTVEPKTKTEQIIKTFYHGSIQHFGNEGVKTTRGI